MKKLNLLTCALICFPTLFSFTAKSAVDNGILYPTALQRETPSTDHHQVFSMSRVHNMTTGLKWMLSTMPVYSQVKMNRRSLTGIRDLTLLLREVLKMEEAYGYVKITDIVELPDDNAGVVMNETDSPVRKKTPLKKLRAKRQVKSTDAKHFVRDGHFYKPFLQRPEMCY